MFGESFPIVDSQTTLSQMHAYQGVAAQTLRAAGIEICEDDRLPFDLLEHYVEIIDPELIGVAKERMISIKGNLGDPGMSRA